MQVVQQNVGNWGYVSPERSFEYGFGFPERGGPVVWNNVEELPLDVQYDFIIIGGGTAGSLVTARLSENPQYNILVIEAGPWHEDIFSSRVPGLLVNLRNTNVDWNYTTVPQSGLNGRRLGYPLGRMLGGSSSFNNMVYTRGSKDDWNKWANVTGDEELSWDRMFSRMLQEEHLVDPPGNQSTERHIDPAVHGRNGKLSLSAPYLNHSFNDMLIQSAEELKDEFPFKLDMNDGRPIGIAWNQFTVDANAERSSSATAYISKTGRNVHVLVNTHVTRVLPMSKDSTDFRKVEFAETPQSERRVLTAKKELILSAGAVGTPRVLLNSGIGSRRELEELGIKTLVDNPSVGKNLTDHPLIKIAFETTMPDTDFDMEAALADWKGARKGPLVVPNTLNHITWVRLPTNATPFNEDGFPDPVENMPNTPHIEMIPLQISSTPPHTAIGIPPIPHGEQCMVTLQVLLSNVNPISRGSISLRTSDPFVHPDIDFNLLGEKVDIAIMREAIRSARRLYSAPVFSGSVLGTVLPREDVTPDEDLDRYIRSMAATFAHCVGTAAMSPRGASWGVVDPDFRVKGTSGLRIVDASVLPSLPSGHTQAPVYGIAERGVVMIE
ncbi:hypothetical protein AGABI1DRAFT_45074 [Agaricus bisporus var. burnettii JB137-S8]|uniref:pyranose dehydrogenase (acceptor) n=1 Tax=Agaricus bisporus var. burnettii (strain JB137-S8 / ATCC MYA-4627 / FGSC 10392) TaxID=597362 RepID=K5WZQ4_AGABU|nr:uncharacterized protein AGABI1DRAFT_45074 [Agaricus bisporus var. burnettii JB137-S8]EKM76333.1 hypothetical protein AGABI1DRAFT_45074 [Agaricus bisporus var. burnettii JB137-S8]